MSQPRISKPTLVTTIVCISLFNCAFQSNQPAVTWQKTLGYDTRELHSISIGKFGYPYVTVSLNGHKLNLVFDTGNMVGLIVSSEIAERMKLPVVGEAKSYDSSGDIIGTNRVFAVHELIAFGEKWRDLRAHEISTRDFDGLIGPRFFSGKRFTLDYQKRVLAVSRTPLPKDFQANSVSVPLVKSPKFPAMILVHGSVNGRETLMQLDTGKSRTCVDPDLVARERLFKSGNGYETKGISLGPYSFSARSAKEVSFKGISEGLPQPILVGIGSDILSQLVLTVDYARQLVTFTNTAREK